MRNSKKVLLTTALVSGLASVAFADAPTVTAGGKVDFQAAFVKQSKTYQTVDTKYDRKQHFVTNTRANVKAEGMTDYGMKYGAFVELGDKSEFGDQDTSSTSGKDLEFKDTVLFVETNMGRVELGSMPGASKTMKLGAESVARATGGASNGDWSDYVNKAFGYIPTSTATTNISGVWLTSAALPFDASTFQSRHNKISYYTPEVSGLQLGVSFTTDTGGIGSSNALSSKHLSAADPVPFSSRHFKNAFSGALKYRTQFDQVAIELAATGQWGKAKEKSSTPALYEQIRNVKAYTVGGTLSYTNLTLAASWGDWGKSMNTKETDAYSRSSTHFYTAGASYVQGPIGLSVTYFDSRRMKNKVETIAVGADYALAAGLMPYVEGTFFKLRPAAGVTTTSGGVTQAVKNKGNVVFVGTKFNF